jgi:hypothetical protein
MKQKQGVNKRKPKTTKLIISTILIVGIIGLVVISLPAQATIAYVNSWSGTKTTTTGTTLAVTVAYAASHTVVITVATVSATVSTITDNAAGGSTAFASLGSTTSGSTVRISIWATTTVGGSKSATSLTVTISVAARMFVGVVEYTGVTFYGAYAGASGSGTNPSRSQSTVSANDWIVGGFSGSIATTPTAGTGNFRQGGSTTALDGSLIDNTAVSPGSVTISETLATSTWVGASVILYQGTFLSQSCTSGPTPLTANKTGYIQGVTTYIRFTCTTDVKAYTTGGSIQATPTFTLPSPYTQLWSFQSSTATGTTCSGGTGAWQMTTGVQHTFPSGSTTWDYCAVIPNTATVDSTSFTVAWNSP